MTSAAEGAVLGSLRVALRVLVTLTVAGFVACGPGNDERRDRIGCSRLDPPLERAPGGGRIAVTSDPDGKFAFDNIESDVFVINADGSGRRRLTTARGNDFSPAWSPDGRQLVFRSDATGGIRSTSTTSST
jgi:WD40-like Beta Propeller Repeat